MKKLLLFLTLACICLSGCSSTTYYLDETIVEDYEWQIENLYEEIENLEGAIDEQDSFLEYAKNYLSETRYITEDNFYHKYECCDLYKKKFDVIILKDASSKYKECPNCSRADYTKYYDYPAYYNENIEETTVIQIGDFYAYTTSYEDVDVNSIVFTNNDVFYHKLICPTLKEPISQMSIEVATKKGYTSCSECIR